MKKSGLFKIIMILIIAIGLLTWFVPASYYSGTELVNVGMYRVGFFDYFQFLFLTFQFESFIQTISLILAIGGLYGVLAQTGSYRKVLEKIAKSLKGKEKLFLILVAFVIAALSSVFGYGLILFLFIPALISIILLLGFDKIVAFAATFVPVLIGSIGATFNFSVVGSINTELGSKFATEIYAKLGLFVTSLALLVLFLFTYIEKASKSKKSAEESKDMFLGEKKTTKVSNLPIYLLFGFLFVLVVLSCTTWENSFGIKVFTNLHKAVTEFAIKEHTVFSYILGNIVAFGEWFYAEVAVMCFLFSLIIGKIYKLKLSETAEAFIDGVKKLIKPALLIVLAGVVLFIAVNASSFSTVASRLMGLTKHLSVGISSFILTISSVLYIDPIYVSPFALPELAATFTQTAEINTLAILTQGIYGLTMFVAPTSAMLILGLEYLNISYTKWLKTSWKLVLEILAVIIAVALVIRYL